MRHGITKERGDTVNHSRWRDSVTKRQRSALSVKRERNLNDGRRKGEVIAG